MTRILKATKDILTVLWWGARNGQALESIGLLFCSPILVHEAIRRDWKL